MEGLVIVLNGEEARTAAWNGRVESTLAAPRDEAELRTAYAAAATRVRGLISANGREAVLGWVQSGLPTKIEHDQH